MNEYHLHHCWTMGSTPVQLKNELPEEIQYLQPGQEVLSLCEKTDKIAYKKITDIFIQKDEPTHFLYYTNSTADENDGIDLRAIEAVSSLLFFVLNKGWTALQDLIAGDVVRSFDSRRVNQSSLNTESPGFTTQTVLGITPTGLNRTVYSLRIEDSDTYFIREEGFLIRGTTNQCLASPKAVSSHEATPQSIIGGFSSDTLVSAKGGHISELQFIATDSEVLSGCATTGELEYRKVLRRVINESMPAYSLMYEDQGRAQNVFAAVGQQFLVHGCGWIEISKANSRMKCNF